MIVRAATYFYATMKTTIEGKFSYWKKLADRGVRFVQDLLNNNGNGLS